MPAWGMARRHANGHVRAGAAAGRTAGRRAGRRGAAAGGAAGRRARRRGAAAGRAAGRRAVGRPRRCHVTARPLRPAEHARPWGRRCARRAVGGLPREALRPRRPRLRAGSAARGARAVAARCRTSLVGALLAHRAHTAARDTAPAGSRRAAQVVVPLHRPRRLLGAASVVPAASPGVAGAVPFPGSALGRTAALAIPVLPTSVRPGRPLATAATRSGGNAPRRRRRTLARAVTGPGGSRSRRRSGSAILVEHRLPADANASRQGVADPVGRRAAARPGARGPLAGLNRPVGSVRGLARGGAPAVTLARPVPTTARARSTAGAGWTAAASRPRAGGLEGTRASCVAVRGAAWRAAGGRARTTAGRARPGAAPAGLRGRAGGACAGWGRAGGACAGWGRAGGACARRGRAGAARTERCARVA
jgi:hypothetical protein